MLRTKVDETPSAPCTSRRRDRGGPFELRCRSDASVVSREQTCCGGHAASGISHCLAASSAPSQRPTIPPVLAARIGKLGTLDWRPIEPAWLRQLCKRWARHRLREGVSVGHVASVRRAILALVEFCELGGWPLDSPACLTRDLFDAFLDHVRVLDQARSSSTGSSSASGSCSSRLTTWGGSASRTRAFICAGSCHGFVIISRARCRQRSSSG